MDGMVPTWECEEGLVWCTLIGVVVYRFKDTVPWFYTLVFFGFCDVVLVCLYGCHYGMLLDVWHACGAD